MPWNSYYVPCKDPYQINKWSTMVRARNETPYMQGYVAHRDTCNTRVYNICDV